MQAFHDLQNVLQGKTEPLIPNNHAVTVKILGMNYQTVFSYKKKKDLEAARVASQTSSSSN